MQIYQFVYGTTPIIKLDLVSVEEGYQVMHGCIQTHFCSRCYQLCPAYRKPNSHYFPARQPHSWCVLITNKPGSLKSN